jgi:hypothetical protein
MRQRSLGESMIVHFLSSDLLSIFELVFNYMLSLIFYFRLVVTLNKTRKKLGIPACDKPLGFNLETPYPCKTIAQLREDPELGIFVINARLADMSGVNAWWYPVCRCDIIIDSYLGAFFCDKCHATEFQPLLK